ncbi:FAD-dependent oxidoreductase [Nocardioides sp. NPDC057767]|uniref:ferredoxin--NADP(+) reductase n=1 Tax=Nocardioides panzhihuensis TaxID=860243 RepID=A0A7Z0DMU1_9ACTN|nr:FAD-dependent oxidoreductase [Nocardioides panzhihuensis]NYI78300.1 ferredoxin--NADP+ reductase [Nocardioides panzhihuensis]
MTHVITGSCCNDAACVPVCPVNCIHPAPGEPDFGTAEMLYIDDASCIDCGACVDVCPVSAITADYDLDPIDEPFLALNSAWFAAPERSSYAPPPREPVLTATRPGPLKVAVVGTGPTGGYVTESLLGVRGVKAEVTVIDRLLTPGGLVRYGVAPDHLATKDAGTSIEKVLKAPGVSVRLGVDVGVDVTLEELAASHHAVVVATGASEGRKLAIPGEDLPGSHSAVDFVGWYNGHPAQAGLEFDLTSERAVVIGNGNVALDVARILLATPDVLRRSDIAAHALEALAESKIREVVLVGRRGPEHAAFTAGELIGLTQVAGLGLSVRPEDLDVASEDPIVAHKLDLLRGLTGDDAEHRLEFRFGLRPTDLLGETSVRAVRFDDGDELEAGLVLSAIGYRGRPVPGLPFDEALGRVPNEDGRVAPGLYVSGWIKRGPSGGIGANKWCAKETVGALVADFEAGLLPDPTGEIPSVGVGMDAWAKIDGREKQLGRESGRPRIKLVDPDEQRTLLSS